MWGPASFAVHHGRPPVVRFRKVGFGKGFSVRCGGMGHLDEKPSQAAAVSVIALRAGLKEDAQVHGLTNSSLLNGLADGRLWESPQLARSCSLSPLLPLLL